MSHWLKSFKPLLGLFLQSNCPLCQRSTDRPICPNCERQIWRCQITNPQQFWQGTLPLFAWGSYGGSLKRSIAALKYDNQPQVAQLLGHWLGQSWGASGLLQSQRLSIVPIPMYAAKRQKRGYDQAELLAQAFCQTTRLRCCSQGLVRVRATEAQFGLSIGDREQNLTDAFSLGKDFLRQPPREPVLLLDDIYTTGATVRAAAQALQQRGILVAGVVAVAKPSRG